MPHRMPSIKNMLCVVASMLLSLVTAVDKNSFREAFLAYEKVCECTQCNASNT